LPRPLYGRSVPAELSSTFADFRPVCYPLAGVLTVFVGLTTLLSIALRRCRPTASSVKMLPLFLRAEQDSPTSRRVPIVCWCSCERHFRLSSVGISSISRFPSVDFHPRGFSGPRRPGDSSGFITCRLLRSANYPCRLRATAHPDRLPSSVRNPSLLSLIGFVLRHRFFRSFARYSEVDLETVDRPIEFLRIRLNGCALASTRAAPGQVTVLTGL